MIAIRRKLKPVESCNDQKATEGAGSVTDGPRHSMSHDDPFVDLKYVTFGFSFLQDAIERALMELATGQKVTTGFLAQQEPYSYRITDRSVLTSFYKPTSGTAYAYGMDICTHMATIGDCLGMCPQHNILFDKLSVVEQLRFCVGLKIRIWTRRSIWCWRTFQWYETKAVYGIALIDGSKLVMLDESTAGIDAHARRSVWHVLLKQTRVGGRQFEQINELAQNETELCNSQLGWDLAG